MPRNAPRHQSVQARRRGGEAHALRPAVPRALVVGVRHAAQPRLRGGAGEGVLDALGHASRAGEEVGDRGLPGVRHDLARGRRHRRVRLRPFAAFAPRYTCERVSAYTSKRAPPAWSVSAYVRLATACASSAASGQLAGISAPTTPRTYVSSGILRAPCRRSAPSPSSAARRCPARCRCSSGRGSPGSRTRAAAYPSAPSWLMPTPWPSPAPWITSVGRAASPRCRVGADERAVDEPAPHGGL